MLQNKYSFNFIANNRRRYSRERSHQRVYELGGPTQELHPFCSVFRIYKVVALSGAFFRYSHSWLSYGFRIGSDRSAFIRFSDRSLPSFAHASRVFVYNFSVPRTSVLVQLHLYFLIQIQKTHSCYRCISLFSCVLLQVVAPLGPSSVTVIFGFYTVFGSDRIGHEVKSQTFFGFYTVFGSDRIGHKV